jgi:hypothetical protein
MAGDPEASVPWRISTWSNGTNCVEVAVQSESVLVRDSKNRSGGTLSVSPSAWQEFVEAVKRNSIA